MFYKTLCPAKINLFLKVVGKTSDGYHDLESLFAFLDLFDELEVKKSEKLKIEIDGEFASILNLEDNLFTKILDFLTKILVLPKIFILKLPKNIPIGGGLGGGSSNAAYFMMALNEIFLLQLDKKELQKISLNFGSDIAFFFEKKAAIVKGRGDIIASFPSFEAIPTLLVNPKINLSTKEVFQKFGHNFSNKTTTEEFLKKDVFDLIKNIGNDLENPAISIVPLISKILNELKNNNAKIAKMSGSGASCFGIFTNENELNKAAENLSQKFPEFLIRKTKILSHV